MLQGGERGALPSQSSCACRGRGPALQLSLYTGEGGDGLLVCPVDGGLTVYALGEGGASLLFSREAAELGLEGGLGPVSLGEDSWCCWLIIPIL